MSTGCELSVVIPSFHGAATLPSLIDGLCEVIDERCDWEVIVVNDSPGVDWEELKGLRSRAESVRIVDLMRNVGQGAATMCGLALARGDVIVTMDDDLQHPPDEVPVLLAALEEDPSVDAVIGSWGPGSGLRGLGTRLYGWVLRVGYRNPEGLVHTGFRAIRRPLVDAMLHHTSARPFVPSVLVECSTHLKNVEVRHDERRAGDSGYSLFKGVRIILNELVQSSLLPLHAVSALGFAAALLSFLITVWVLAAWAFGGETPPGWASSVLAPTFLSGVVLVGIGLLGRYVEVVIAQLRHPPIWYIRRSDGIELEDPSEFVRAVRDRPNGNPD